MPDETMEAFKKYGVGIKGPLTTPVGGGIRSLNVAPPAEIGARLPNQRTSNGAKSKVIISRVILDNKQ